MEPTRKRGFDEQQEDLDAGEDFAKPERPERKESALIRLGGAVSDDASLLELFAEVRAALRVPLDPKWDARRYDLKRRLELEMRQLAGGQDAEREVSWGESYGPRRSAEVFVGVPERLVQRALARVALPCVVGAARTLSAEGRGDNRGRLTFLGALRREASKGLHLLDELESQFATAWRVLGPLRSDTVIPELLLCALALPAFDASWLSEVMNDEHQRRRRGGKIEARSFDRTVQRGIARFEQAGLIVPWAAKAGRRVRIQRGRGAELWRLASFNEDLEIGAARGLEAQPVAEGRWLESGSLWKALERTSRQDSVLSLGQSLGSMDRHYAMFESSLDELDAIYGRWFGRHARTDRKTSTGG